ncbi:MAG: glutaminyl-peptide cyclotransferase [Flavobacteriales bacterium]|nr:glutaminyl-peptide cyclotransferase [Flavobacteriales bacterium]
MLNRKLTAAAAALILICSACEDEGPRRSIDRPSLGTKQPPLKLDKNSDRLVYGDTIMLAVVPEDGDLTFAKVRISLADERGSFLAVSDDSVDLTEKASFALPTALTGGGEVKLRVDAEFNDGQKSMRYQNFTVTAESEPQQWNFETVRKYPHDKSSFTQGLLFHNGFLYEGTGNLGESRIRKIDLTTGNVEMEKANKSDVFGEGITVFRDKLYQLTYKNGRGFVYNLGDFEKIDEFTYNTYTGEGWGLTHNDTSLIASDGSAYLHFIDPETLEEERRIRVFDHRGNVNRLNELEYREGIIYANLYTSFEMVAIDATTGRVLHRYNARDVLKRADMTTGMDVLNGIAVNPLNGNLLITGKYWQYLYEVKPTVK